jgi:membrane protease YdiL (CAAX protease family)
MILLMIPQSCSHLKSWVKVAAPAKLEELSKTTYKIKRLVIGGMSYLIVYGTQSFLLAQAVERGLMSTDLMQEAQRNWEICPVEEKFSVLQKIAGSFMSGMHAIIGAPCVEEFVFRELFQKELLKNKGASLLERCSSQNAAGWKKGIRGQLIRTALLTSCFALGHLGQYSDTSRSRQGEVAYIHVFGIISLGFYAGVLHERLGYFGSLGLHMVYNTVASVPHIYRMITKC